MQTNDTGEKLLRLIFKWARIAYVWISKSVKIRVQKIRLVKAKKNLDRRMSRLGAEFYSIYRQGDTEFLKSLVVLQQLKIAEEAERRVFVIYDGIDAIEKEYMGRMKKSRHEVCEGNTSHASREA
jgi:hypothetical protein